MLDQLTRHQIWLERYGNNIVKNDIIPLLTKMRDEIALKLINATAFQIARQSQLLKEIDQIISGAVTKIQPSLFESFQELGDYETTWSAKLLDDSTVASVTIGAGLEPVVITTMLQNNKMFLSPDSTGETIDDLIKRFGKAISKDVKSLITTGLTAGDTTDVIARNMVVLSKTRTIDQARAVVLTVANHVSTDVQLATWGPYQELFEGLEHNSVLDQRVTPECMKRDGAVWTYAGIGVNQSGKENKFRKTPLHYRCRSKILPKIKEEYVLIKDGTRASMNGQVPAKWTYNDWLKRQSAAVQDEVLGKARGLAYRKSGEPIDKFIDRKGVFYSLQELKAKDLLK